MTQASTAAPTAPIVPSALNLTGFRTPDEIAMGVPPRTSPAVNQKGVADAYEKTASVKTLAANHLPPGVAEDTFVHAASAPHEKISPTEKTVEAKPVKPARKPTAKKPKAERKPRIPPLTRKERFEVDSLIMAASASETDASLADVASAMCSRAVSTQYIKDARIALGLRSVAEPSKAEMRARLLQLERELEEAKQGRLFLDPTTNIILQSNRAFEQLVAGAGNVVASDTKPADESPLPDGPGVSVSVGEAVPN